MALNVRFSKLYNHLLDEDIVIPRLVNQQTLDFNQICEYLADGSTVTATDVAAVMKRIETKLPFLLGLNTKVICSPEGLMFRPAVSGSITQSQLKAKLEERLANETDPVKAEKIDVNRALKTSDLTVDDLTASIVIDLPKKWKERFHSEASFNRVASASSDETEDGTGSTDGDSKGDAGAPPAGGGE